MTFAIRKKPPTELEQQYAEMKKQTGDGRRNPNWVKNVEVNSKAGKPTDTVTLSDQPDQNQLKPNKSEPVSPVEKQALHISVRA
jgi:hypothetical protein